MKNYIIILGVLISTLFLFSSCNTQKTKINNKLITVSILPQKYFVEKIAGEHFDVNVMIPVGASPASYDPAPKDIQNLSESVAYFRIGKIGFEIANMKKLEELNPEMKIFDLSKDILFSEEKHHHHGETHHHHGGVNPHIWMSTKNVKIISQNIYNALALLQPENREIFKKNLETFVKEIATLNSALNKDLETFAGSSFFIYHPALTYFASEYNLNQFALEFEGKTPTPAHLKSLVDKAKKDNIHLIFIQKEFDITNANMLASEINGKTFVINPLAENWKKEMLEIGTLLRGNL